MQYIFKRMTIALIIISFFATPFSVAAAEWDNDVMANAGVSDAAMAADTVLVRPLGLVSTIAGFGLFIVSSPFSALGGNIGEAWGTLVAKPAKFTFKRPLGEF